LYQDHMCILCCDAGVSAGSSPLVQGLARVPPSFKGWREFRRRSRAGAKIESSTVAYLRSALIDRFWTLVGSPHQAGAGRQPRDRRPTGGGHGWSTSPEHGVKTANTGPNPLHALDSPPPSESP